MKTNVCPDFRGRAFIAASSSLVTEAARDRVYSDDVINCVKRAGRLRSGSIALETEREGTFEARVQYAETEQNYCTKYSFFK